jgi:hypothetical protein
MELMKFTAGQRGEIKVKHPKGGTRVLKVDGTLGKIKQRENYVEYWERLKWASGPMRANTCMVLNYCIP